MLAVCNPFLSVLDRIRIICMSLKEVGDGIIHTGSLHLVIVTGYLRIDLCKGQSNVMKIVIFDLFPGITGL